MVSRGRRGRGLSQRTGASYHPGHDAPVLRTGAVQTTTSPLLPCLPLRPLQYGREEGIAAVQVRRADPEAVPGARAGQCTGALRRHEPELGGVSQESAHQVLVLRAVDGTGGVDEAAP